MKLYKFANIEGGTTMYNAGRYMTSPKNYDLNFIEESRNRYYFGNRTPKAVNDVGRLRRFKARAERR